ATSRAATTAPSVDGVSVTARRLPIAGDPEAGYHDGVEPDEQEALAPLGVPVADHVRDDDGREGHGAELDRAERERQRGADRERQEHHRRRDEERDLRA